MKVMKIDFEEFNQALESLVEMGVKELAYNSNKTEDENLEFFMSAIETIAEDQEDLLPDEVVDFYNKIAEAQEKGRSIVLNNAPTKKEKTKKSTKKTKKKTKPDPNIESKKEEKKTEPESKKEEKKTKTKKATKPPVTKKKAKDEPAPEKKVKAAEKAKETPKKGTSEIDALGARLGSGTSKINDMLLKGADVKDIAKKVDTPLGRVKNHVYALMKREDKNYKIEKKDNYIKVTLSK